MIRIPLNYNRQDQIQKAVAFGDGTSEVGKLKLSIGLRGISMEFPKYNNICRLQKRFSVLLQIFPLLCKLHKVKTISFMEKAVYE